VCFGSSTHFPEESAKLSQGAKGGLKFKAGLLPTHFPEESAKLSQDAKGGLILIGHYIHNFDYQRPDWTLFAQLRVDITEEIVMRRGSFE